MRDPRLTYARAQALAADPGATESEAASARRILEALEARYGPGISNPPAPEASVALPYSSPPEKFLAVQIARFLDLATTRTGYRREDGKGVRWRPEVHLTGDPALVDLAAQLYAEHRIALAQILLWTAYGYGEGVFPNPNPPEDAEAPPIPVSAELRAALNAGFGIGKKKRRSATPSAPLITTATRALPGPVHPQNEDPKNAR